MSQRLLERSSELEELAAWLSGVRARQGGLVAVTGVAGIGKTELVRATIELGRESGMRVLAARGNEMESDFSFGVVRQLFEPALSAPETGTRSALLEGAARHSLIALEGEITSSDDADRSFAVVHGLYWLAVNLAGSAPLLIAVDDLQWSDEASVRWVLYMADRLQDYRWGCCCRGVPATRA